MSKRKKDPALEQEGFKRRLFCWIRRRRAMLAVHKALYYELSEPMLEDLQFDYLEAELAAVERRHPDMAAAVTADGYLSPDTYVDSLRLEAVTERARSVLSGWVADGRPRLSTPVIRPDMTPGTLYRDALPNIVRYPI